MALLRVGDKYQVVWNGSEHVIVFTDDTALQTSDIVTYSNKVPELILTVGDLLSSSTLDEAPLPVTLLVAQNAQSYVTLNEINVIQAHTLVIGELLSDTILDNVGLNVLAEVNSLNSNSTLDNIDIVVSISVNTIISESTISKVELSAHLEGVPDNLLTESTLGRVDLIQSHVLTDVSNLSSSTIFTIYLLQNNILDSHSGLSSPTISTIVISPDYEIFIGDLDSSTEISDEILYLPIRKVYLTLTGAIPTVEISSE